MKCPHCKKEIHDDATLRKIGASLMGKKGKGKAKARTSEQAREAARVRWLKYIKKP